MSDLDHTTPHTPDHPALNPADAQALDALIDSGWRANAGDARTLRVEALMALLGTPVSGESERVARVSVIDLKARRAALAAANEEDLSDALRADDAAALDHWMEGPDTVPEALRARVDRHDALAALASAGGSPSAAEDRQRLIDRTFQAVQAADRAQARALRFEDHAEPGAPRFRLADLISVAATLLILVSVAIPAFNGAARYREQSLSMANMQTAARAFGTYAGANADMLPMASAGFGGSWMDVGNPNRSNSANLYTLPREGYLRLDDLASPSNPNAPRGTPEPGAMDWKSMEEISYSYRIMSNGGLRLHVSVPTTTRVVVMADRSPVTLRVARGEMVFPEENTPNNQGRGQHVLRLDGSSLWSKSPVIDGDNIWLPRQIEEIIREVRSRMGVGVIQGNEMPASETDAFVGP
jgi:hypothetical protein